VEALGPAEYRRELDDTTRTTLFSICWAVSVEPPVWVWNLSCFDFGFCASNRSSMIVAHIRRAARNFAASSKMLLWALKKKES